MFDIIYSLVTKIIFIFGFVFFLNFLFRKTDSVGIVIIYWVLGVIFVIVPSHTIFEWLYTLLFFDEDNIVLHKKGIGSLAALSSLAFYIFIGVKFFERKKIRNKEYKKCK